MMARMTNNDWANFLWEGREALYESGIQSVYENYSATTGGKAEAILVDVVGKLIKYGSISDAQVGLIRRLMDQITRAPQIAAERAAETAAAAPCPNGRVVIRGEVLSVKFNQGAFNQTKVLVKSAEGWKVWGTMPKGLNAERGATVEFTATVSPKADDPKFGFFSRPTCRAA